MPSTATPSSSPTWRRRPPRRRVKGGETRSLPLDEARQKMGPIADALILDQVIESGRNVEIGWRPLHESFLAAAPAAYAEWKAARA